MKRIIIFSLTLLVLSSCNEWLNVTPKGEVAADNLLQDEKGYNAALAGIHYTLTANSMFGGELTYAMMDVLAQYWDVSGDVNHSYRYVSELDFNHSTVSNRVNQFWIGYYNAIAQCNRILEGFELNRESIEYSELMEAEALGMRAFCHMELFRMFGPIIKEDADLDKKSICYRTKFDIEALLFESGRSILEKAKADLLAALELTKDDPIKKYGRMGDANRSILDYNNIIAKRGCRMNYYAILALLARNEQLMLNQEGAYTYAKMILDEMEENPIFKLVDRTDLNVEEVFRDYNYSKEIIFGLYCENLYELTNPTFGMDPKTTYSAGGGFRITSAGFQKIVTYIYLPEGSGSDNRVNYWFEKQISTGNYDFTKLREAKAVTGIEVAYYPEIPVIRLSEIYYIACEALIGKDNALALSYLNKVRVARNLMPIAATASDATLLNSLMIDMRKDFIGDGHMYMTYKRLSYTMSPRPGLVIPPSEDIYVFKIPEQEYDYSPNEKPGT